MKEPKLTTRQQDNNWENIFSKSLQKKIAQQVGYCDSWWPGAESNHRHKDFKSYALPTAIGRFETMDSIPTHSRLSTQSRH